MERQVRTCNIIILLLVVPILYGCDNLPKTDEVISELQNIKDNINVEKIEDVNPLPQEKVIELKEEELQTEEEIIEQPIEEPKFEDVVFISISKEDEEYYLSVINSIPFRYYDKLNGIRVYNPENTMYSDDANYFIETQTIRTNCDRGNFKYGLIHELAHHNAYMRKGRFTYENQNHLEEFKEVEQEIINSLK